MCSKIGYSRQQRVIPRLISYTRLQVRQVGAFYSVAQYSYLLTQIMKSLKWTIFRIYFHDKTVKLCKIVLQMMMLKQKERRNNLEYRTCLFCDRFTCSTIRILQLNSSSSLIATNRLITGILIHIIFIFYTYLYITTKRGWNSISL